MNTLADAARHYARGACARAVIRNHPADRCSPHMLRCAFRAGAKWKERDNSTVNRPSPDSKKEPESSK
jgi:hypothetical protein